MNLEALRAAAIKAAQEIIAKGDLTDADRAELTRLKGEVEEYTKKIDAAKADEELLEKFRSFGAPVQTDETGTVPAKSLGDHFVKSVGEDGLSRIKTVNGAQVDAPEFKAATDTQTLPAGAAPWLTEYDKTVVRAFRRPVVSDLFGVGVIGDGANAVSYFIEGAVEGAFAAVAEGGNKPQVHIADPEARTDGLKKIAGFLKFSDEMIEDAAFLVNEINERGLYLLALAEENQLLNGAGTGAQIQGLLNRAGVQTEAAANAADVPDAFFRALTKIQTATGLSADAIVINPVDYQALRLNKDGNGQYFGGGYFAGQYGNGGIDWQPPIWGLNTVVSTAVAPGTAIVGAFKAGGTVYRKGGVRVEATNSHDTTFTSNVITTRIEERVALAVRIPAAYVKLDISGGSGD